MIWNHEGNSVSDLIKAEGLPPLPDLTNVLAFIISSLLHVAITKKVPTIFT